MSTFIYNWADGEAAYRRELGMVRCARTPNTWHKKRAPRCDCGACCHTRANGRRAPHARCYCGGVSK